MEEWCAPEGVFPVILSSISQNIDSFRGTSSDAFEKVQQAAVLDIQRLWRGFRARRCVRAHQLVKKEAALCVKSRCRSFKAQCLLVCEKAKASKTVVHMVLEKSLRRVDEKEIWRSRRKRLSAYLISACDKGEARLVDLFLEAGADRNVCLSRRHGDSCDGTPLMIAAANGHVSIVQMSGAPKLIPSKIIFEISVFINLCNCKGCCTGLRHGAAA